MFKKVLLLEPDQSIRECIEGFLGESHIVFGVATPEEAFAKIETHRQLGFGPFDIFIIGLPLSNDASPAQVALHADRLSPGMSMVLLNDERTLTSLVNYDLVVEKPVSKELLDILADFIADPIANSLPISRVHTGVPSPA